MCWVTGLAATAIAVVIGWVVRGRYEHWQREERLRKLVSRFRFDTKQKLWPTSTDWYQA